MQSDLTELSAMFDDEPQNIAFDIGIMVAALEHIAKSGNANAVNALKLIRSKFVRCNLEKRLTY